MKIDPPQQMLAVLNDAIARVQAGQVRGLLIITIGPDNPDTQTHTSVSPAFAPSFILPLEMAKHEILTGVMKRLDADDQKD